MASASQRKAAILHHYYYSRGGKSEPDDFSGLRFWIAARKEEGYNNEDPVGSPKDFSGLSVSVSNTATQRPQYLTNIVNSLPSYKFDGTNDWWIGSKDDFDFLHQGDSTVIWLVQLTTNTVTQPLFDSCGINLSNIGRFMRFNYDSIRMRWQDACAVGNSSNDVFNFTPAASFPIAANVPILIVARYKKGQDGDDYNAQQNGVNIGTDQGNSDPSTSTSTNIPRIGANVAGNSRFSGHLLECIMYDEYRTDEELQKILGGLPYEFYGNN
jgi:hypothetical protein